MASPAFIRLSVGASIITTGAAAYYFLSEGGDPDKLQSNLRDTTNKVNQSLASASDWADRVRSTVTAPLQPAVVPAAVPIAAEEQRTTHHKVQEQVQEKVQDGRDNADNPEKKASAPRQTGAHCHTCSGPRIWFFAEKLRLKRRITPYPDPVRE